jgi:hypothetical protein
MKRLLLIPILLCLFVSCKSKIRTAFIKAQDIANYLDDHYDFESRNTKVYFNLAKKKDGWYVQQCEYKEDGSTGVVKEECCWAADKKAHVPIKLAPQGKSETPYFAPKFQSDIADRVPYFGYAAWAKDVIADFEGNTEDTTLEALARAYEHYANGFLDARLGDQLPEQKNGTLDDRLKLYMENMDKSIAAYGRLEKQNPKYEVLVGGIHTKYGNTKMAAWYDLNQAGRDDLAKKYLDEKLYDPLILSLFRNTLNACPKDAVFISFGDNDTYPVWYLQQVEGVRKDVHVVNHSLLNLPTYIESIRAKGVSFTIKKEVYNDLSYVFVEDNIGRFEELSWEDFIARMRLEPADKLARINQKHIQIPQQFFNDTLAGRKSLSLKNSILYLGDLAMIDLMLSNIGKHPVCFSQYCGSLNFNTAELTLTHFYFSTFELPKERTANSFIGTYGQFNLDASWEEFKAYSTFDTTSTDRYFGKQLVESYRLQSSQYARAFAEKDPSKAKAILEKCETIFPNKNWPYGFSSYYLFEGYCLVDDLKKAEAIGLTVIKSTQENLKKAKGENRQMELDRARAVFSNIKEQAQAKGLTSVETRAKEALASLDNEK